MDEFRIPKPSNFLQMNSSNVGFLNNMASFEGYSSNPHGMTSLSNDQFSDHHQLPPYDDQLLRSIGPNVPVFDSTIMAHFFPSGHGCSTVSEPEIMVNSSPSVSGAGFLGPHKVNKKHHEQNGGKKRKKVDERESDQKPKDVVHVRAKRGQATDSHSLAERLRREKINDKLKCLQDLVPGCYKTMGMAVMLDVIINYVRSLQNQIDFLSMKLSAASLVYDFNSSEAEAMEALQGTNGYEAGQMMEKLVGDGYGGISQFQTAAWPF